VTLVVERCSRCLAALLLACAVVLLAAPGDAFGDGDPGSDVLVNQNLFVPADAGLSIAQQVRLGGMLQDAARAGFPIRVAVIASPADLGAITPLWRRPRTYAQFLGIELSLAYKQRLLVVMPNGFGFNWPGHDTTAAYAALGAVGVSAGPSGLLASTEGAVRDLARAAGVNLDRVSAAAPSAGSSAPAGASAPASAGTTGGADSAPPPAVVLGVVAALAALGGAVVLLVRRRRRPRSARWDRPALVAHLPSLRRADGRLRRPSAPKIAFLVAVALIWPVLAFNPHGGSSSQSEALAANPNVDPGTPLGGPAPDFTLSNQFGEPVSLHSYAGKVVLLAFNDSECTTTCPLTTTAMLQAKEMLGSSGSHVALLGVDANPDATALEDVYSYSEVHGLLTKWSFLTGSLPQLRRVWAAYHVEAEAQRGLISHTPALFVISPAGRLAKVYLTQQSYAAIGQFAQVLAQEASSLLPEHPPVHSDISYQTISGISPTANVSLPRSGGGRVELGPGGRGHLLVFFATWDREFTSLAGHLQTLNGYASAAARAGLPALTAVDEGSVEPSPATLSSFLHGPGGPALSYPVAIDRSGRIADGYEVQGQPWFVLTSAAGRILWYWQVSTSGWPTPAALVAHVRGALAHAPRVATAGGARAPLAGAPPPLVELHAQADQVLGSESALAARVRALRGYPIVLNAWASWCTPCQSEFGLFASASQSFGRRVAFLGADTDDSTGNGRSFLAEHPVSYPSYEASSSDLSAFANIEGLPTTIYINRAGKVAYVHIGQYDSQGSLDEDIDTYALAGGGT